MTRLLLPLLLLFCNSALSLDVASGKKKYQEVCASCHGQNGVSTLPGTPHVAGQYRSYLEQSMRSYRSGIRQDPVMQSFISQLEDQDIKNISAYLSTKPGPLSTSPRKSFNR